MQTRRRTLRHGAAVATGMLLASHLAHQLGLLASTADASGRVPVEYVNLAQLREVCGNVITYLCLEPWTT